VGSGAEATAATVQPESSRASKSMSGTVARRAQPGMDIPGFLGYHRAQICGHMCTTQF
jgi:hypothetical protein